MRVAHRYVIETELARGGMATVYQATDTSSGQVVALKRLGADADARIRALFRREYYTLSQLRHPRIISVHDYGVDEAGAWYAMELLGGADLRELAPMPVAQVGRVLRDVASALALLHARRLLHRDLSPRNVRVDGSGRAKVLDFGALAPFGVATQVVGTPPGIPPEALDRLPLDGRADLFALGGLAYWMLTKRHAYPAADLADLRRVWAQGSPPPPSSLADGVPAALDDLVLSLLSLEPIGRPRTASAVIQRLEALGFEGDATSDEVVTGYLANPPIVDRSSELAAIDAAVRSLGAERAGAVCLHGLRGLGKSRLLLEATHRARFAGAAVALVDARMHPGPNGVIRAVLSALVAGAHPAVIRCAAPHAPWLAHLAPSLAERLDHVTPAPLPVDRAEQRLRLNEAVLAFLRDVTADQPLCLSVDHADDADEVSLGVLSALLCAPDARSVVVCTASTASPHEGPLARLAAAGVEIALEPLSPTGTHAMAAGLFGEVPRLARLAAWLHDRTGGSPAHIVALAARLADEGHVRFREGAWAIPDALPDGLHDQDLTELYRTRLANLSPAARALASRLSVHRGATPLARCLELSDDPAAAVLDGLAELVAHGLLVVHEDTYRFHHAALRDHLVSMLSDEARQELHRRTAERILADEGATRLDHFDAGWHLIRGGEALRGADLLQETSRGLTSSIEGLAWAAPALEAALEVYDAHTSSPWVRLPVLDALTAAGWYVDYRYVERYGEETLDLALQVSGLRSADTLARVAGASIGLKAGLLGASVRHALLRRRTRHDPYPEFADVLRPIVGAVGILVGVAASFNDGPQARRILEKVRVLRAFPPDHVLHVMYDYARVYTLMAMGRPSEAESLALRVLGWFRSPEGIEALGDEASQALTGGILTGLATLAAYRDDVDVEHWAGQLEGLGLSFYRAMATQARFNHHLLRGELERARPYRERLEQHALEGGTLWQSTVLVAIFPAAVAARSGDIDGLQGALSTIAELARHVQPLEAMVELYGACLDLLSGAPARARERLEREATRLGIHHCGEGILAAATLARSLMALGELDEARVQVEAIRASLNPRDEPYAMGVLDAHLVQAELAVAEGDARGAAAIYDAALATREPQGGPLTLCRLHEGRARVAAMLGDEEGADHHLARLEHWARSAENPVWIGRSQRTRRQLDHTFGRAEPVTGSDADPPADTWHSAMEPLFSASSLFATPAPAGRMDDGGPPRREPPR